MNVRFLGVARGALIASADPLDRHAFSNADSWLRCVL
jgi:hypothetical protein